MTRLPSRIFDKIEKKRKKLPKWELVDGSGNRLIDEPVSARTAGDAASLFFSQAGHIVRKVEDDPTRTASS
jgi:hypothetical protein